MDLTRNVQAKHRESQDNGFRFRPGDRASASAMSGVPLAVASGRLADWRLLDMRVADMPLWSAWALIVVTVAVVFFAWSPALGSDSRWSRLWFWHRSTRASQSQATVPRSNHPDIDRLVATCYALREAAFRKSLHPNDVPRYGVLERRLKDAGLAPKPGVTKSSRPLPVEVRN